MIPLIQEEVVNKKRWIEEEDFMDAEERKRILAQYDKEVEVKTRVVVKEGQEETKEEKEENFSAMNRNAVEEKLMAQRVADKEQREKARQQSKEAAEKNKQMQEEKKAKRRAACKKGERRK